MGALFSSLKGKDSQPENVLADININFEESQPNNNEKALYDTISGLQLPMDDFLSQFRSYKGCSEDIRQAISNPTEENNLQVWTALQPCISISVKLFKYSHVVEDYLPKLLDFLCSGSNPTTTLESNQAITKLLSKTLSFIFEFDQIKMANSDIQNDFSYYRRSINKFKMMDKSLMNEAIVSDEEANHMSLFYAHHTPLFKSTSEVITKFSNEKPQNKANLTKLLSSLAGGCYHSLIKQRFSSPATRDEILRTMVTCTVLYDRLSSDGIFVKTSGIDIRQIVKAIQAHSGAMDEQPLMNGLRFNLVHLNDKTTPKQLKALLGA